MFIKFIIIIAVIILSIVVYFSFLSFSTRHDNIKEVSKQQLLPCPNKPNCVLSSSSIQQEMISPFKFIHADALTNWQALSASIEEHGGVLVVQNDTYLHAVFTSTLFRFKDDFEAQLNDNEINIRSASRAGKSDLGQNRKRAELIRTSYQTYLAQ